MTKRLTGYWFVIALLVVTALPSVKQVRTSPKGEDDFQLIKVADGVYAAIAKPGGLAVDQAKEQLTLPEKCKSFAFQNFAKPNRHV